jgi:pimeloyl-ACP methyl ester carboxylesterase
MADREALVLLHGLGMSARVWDDLRPILEAHHEVVALTALGHRGGTPSLRRPVTVQDLVDDAERALDQRGLERPHVAGNSIGGWMAIELARRGRASTVCALAPAGSWTAGTPEQTAGANKIRRALWSAKLGRPLPQKLLMRPALARRLALRDVAEHAERLTPDQAVEATKDLLGCVVLDDILVTGEQIAPLDPLPCPITLAWSGEDKLLPVAVNGEVARARLPQAAFVTLPGLGHVPMIDDGQTVAQTILRTTGAIDGS